MSIVLENLTKVFAGRRVVDRFSLEVGDGELFVLLGSSGSGKSTVLRIIAGLTPENEGSVTLFGRDVTNLPAQERGVGFVFQNYSIFRHMTVAQNIEFGLRLRRVPRAERSKRSAELLERIGLGGLGGRYASQLSGGQQQRVALARALAYEPRVLLLDEPFGALDAKIRVQLRRALRDIQRALHVTTILVTHDQEEAFELGDRIGVVEHGRLLEVGTPESLYARPQSFFVATFIGTGAVLVGRCEDGNARFGPITLPIPAELPHEEGGPIRMLVRPEQVRLMEAPPLEDGTVALGKAKVVEQTFAGGTRRVRARLPEIPGLRQIFPAVPYGEEGILIDAILPADQPVPPEALICLTGWRILAQPQRRVLAIDTGGGSTDALAGAAVVARTLGASLRILGIARDGAQVERLRTLVTERAAAAGAPDAEVRIRTGDRDEQAATELAETYYHLCVAAARAARDRRRGAFVSPAAMERSGTPVLFVRGPLRPIQNLLLCTAIGEPGRAAIRFGGWLATRLGARVRLLHVHREGQPPPAWVLSHLDLGVRTLHGQSVAADYRVRPAATPAEGILAEARQGEHDLIVIGKNAARARSRDDVTAQVLQGSDRPVLVVGGNG